MATIVEDLKTVIIKISNTIKIPYSICQYLVGKLKFKKNESTPKIKKVGILSHFSYKIFPKAKLTYWLADEEVIVYVSRFHHGKFKITFTELTTGRAVIVNSSAPINYRLEQLKPGDLIKDTEVQQDQRY